VLKGLIPVEREVRENDRWFLTRLQPYRTLEDHIAGVVLTCVDVTARRRAEAILADDLKHMERLRKVSERLIPQGHSQDFFEAILAAAIEFTDADAGAVQLLDRSRSALLLLAASGFTPEMLEHFARVDATAASAPGSILASGQRVLLHFETSEGAEGEAVNRLHLAAGLHSGQSTPLVARSGRALGMISTHWRDHHQPGERELRFFDLLVRQAADAVERKQAEDSLRESEERLRLLLESAKDHAIFTLDPQRRVNGWNAGAQAMFGYAESEILGRESEVLFTPEDQAKGVPEREANEARETGRAGNERWHLRKDGSYFYGSGSVLPLRDKLGVLHGFVKIMRDLTESKHTQEELREQMDELKRFNVVAVDRESRMVELKQEINELCQRLGEPGRYAGSQEVLEGAGGNS
jgi:PAS domain S-box-containing protein